MSRDLVLIALSLFTWGAGEGMFIYFYPIYLQRWGADPVEIGVILGGVGVVMTLVQAPAGYLADRFGTRPIIRLAWVLGLLSTVLMALASSLALFVAGIMLYGVTSFVSAPMNSYITRARGRLSVERAITFVSGVFHLGAVVGPWAGGLLGERLGLSAVFAIASGIFFFSSVLVFLLRHPPEPETAQVTAGARPHLLRSPRFAGLVFLMALTMFSLYLPQPLTAVFLENDRGISLSQMGQLGSAGSLGTAVVMLAAGQLNAGAGMFLGQVLVGLFALLIWRGSHMAWFSIAYFFWGGYRLCRAMALAFARRLVPVDQVGLAFGLIETGNAAAVIAAPLAAGFLYTASADLLYITSLGFILLMLVVNLVVLRFYHKPA